MKQHKLYFQIHAIPHPYFKGKYPLKPGSQTRLCVKQHEATITHCTLLNPHCFVKLCTKLRIFEFQNLKGRDQNWGFGGGVASSIGATNPSFPLSIMPLIKSYSSGFPVISHTEEGAKGQVEASMQWGRVEAHEGECGGGYGGAVGLTRGERKGFRGLRNWVM